MKVSLVLIPILTLAPLQTNLNNLIGQVNTANNLLKTLNYSQKPNTDTVNRINSQFPVIASANTAIPRNLSDLNSEVIGNLNMVYYLTFSQEIYHLHFLLLMLKMGIILLI